MKLIIDIDLRLYDFLNTYPFNFNSPSLTDYLTTSQQHSLVVAIRNAKPYVEPTYDCRSCKNNGNERYCLDCHDYCNFVRYEARPQGEWQGGELGHCTKCGHKGSASDIWSGCDGMFCPNCGANLKGGAE